MPYTIWMDDQWVEFPETILHKHADIRSRWIRVLKVAANLDPGPKYYDQRILDEYLLIYRPDDDTPTAATSVTIRRIRDNIKRRVRLWQQSRALDPTATHSELTEAVGATKNDLTERYLRWLESEKPTSRNSYAERDRRIVLVLSDFHGAPHSNILPAIFRIIDQNPSKEILLLCVGDLFNIFATHPARQALKDPQRGAAILKIETQNINAFLYTVTTRYPHVQIKLLPGNHDQVIKLMGDQGYAVLQVLGSLFETDPITLLAQPYKQVSVGGINIDYIEPDGTLIKDFVYNRYIHVEGDILVSHTNHTGKDAHRALWAWIQDKRCVAGLGHIRVALQAHVHRLIIEDVQGGHVQIGLTGFAGDVKQIRYQWGYAPWTSDISPGFIALAQERRINGQWARIRESVIPIRY